MRYLADQEEDELAKACSRKGYPKTDVYTEHFGDNPAESTWKVEELTKEAVQLQQYAKRPRQLLYQTGGSDAINSGIINSTVLL